MSASMREFILFLECLDRGFPLTSPKVRHVLDNLKMHKGKGTGMVGKHPRFVFHHPYSLFLNEIRRAMVQRSPAI